MKIEDLRIVENPTLVRDHAVEKLRDAISTGFYKPGTRLVERELCEALGVSRTSVREAMRQLQAENLVTVGPRRNISVTVLSPEDAEDIYVLREMIEAKAVHRLVRRNDQAVISELTGLWKDMQKAIRKNDLPTLSKMAGAFNEAVLRGSGSKVIHDTGLQLLKRVSYLRLASMSEPGRLEGGMEEWDAMMDAVERRDADAAAEAMARHVRESRQAIVSRLNAERDAEREAS
ncbi:GntR family transcriptional regulator [Pacificimonas flava]|uniref:GntR family transcriptional regulator n=2 Tax=Pacificimonas TaxID=1960290 RepID=A0A219B4M3_9SPHN|nr:MULTISPECIES: GntR family transcriptional regulator [Pacificimonas]MBZ6377153.1 GntR family transcriptional regulator [Pacificimonas aurantium]OWV33124.1 GntR family transcriptional regulator [Pacificimonas flava]